ncbi:ketopantoate reductase family protein [Nocardia fusca]|uniref:ketopantoate reductase family protein n=1 Tax=Nocardia fusca TaxID=941183 RepID=UPI0007A75E65|nr:2-dehydropantoate 2-reductase N-terminal domain-containing protein [Nocardia fusca]
MRILVVGDGALGQVFGLRLARGGADVTYLVKPERAGWGGPGRTLYRLRRFGGPVAEQLRPEGVHTEPPDGPWDMVWLCVSSTALRGSWLPGLRDAVGDASAVTIGQDVHDRAVLERVWPAEQIVQVVPSLFAYAAPLTGEVPAPGIAYWVPPGSALQVLGDPARAAVASALRAGGLRARRSARAGTGEHVAALMVPYIAALEAAGWSLPALLSDIGPAVEAGGEASAVVAAQAGGRRVRAPKWVARSVLRLLRVLPPFDLDRYLEAHFTKVADQTRLMLDGWIAEGETRALPVTRLRDLRNRLSARETA